MLKCASLTACLVLAMGAFACSKKTESNQSPAPSPPPATTDVKARLDASADLKAHMQGHFEAVRDIERAIVNGELDKAKERATWLATHETHADVEAWAPHLEAVKTAAEALAASATLDDAAQRAAELGAECANCHVTLTAITSFEWNELPADKGDPKSHMQRHQWAADRLWEGLVGPSLELWMKGAEVLIDAPLRSADLTKDQAVAQQVDTFASQIHALGSQAHETSDRSQRTALYGKLIATCSACHGLIRPKK